MRILTVAAVAADSGTGPPVFVRNWLEGARSVGGHDVIMMHVTRGAHEVVQELGENQHVSVAQAPFAATILTAPLFGAAIRKRIKESRPDVVDLQNPELGAVVAGAGIPVVTTVHGIVPVQLRSGLLPRSKAPLFPFYRRNWWKGLRASDRVICLTDHDAAYLRDHGLRQVVRVPIPRAERYFTTKHERAHSLLSIGIVSPRKNQLAQLEVVERLVREHPNARLRIVGSLSGEGDPGYSRLLRASIRSRGLTDRVSLVGRLSSDRVIEELRCASVFVHTSIQETLPGAIVEAMASATPVVAMENPGTRALIRDQQTGFLVAAGDTERFAVRCGELLRDPELRYRFGSAAQESAREEYSAAAVARIRVSIFERAISSSRHGL